LEETAQQVYSGIAAWLECVTVNIIWNILHRVGQWYCSLNGVRYSLYFLESTLQQVDTGIAVWM